MKKIKIDNGLGGTVIATVSILGKKKYDLTKHEMDILLTIASKEGKTEALKYILLLDYYNLGYITFDNYNAYKEHILIENFGITNKDLEDFGIIERD